MFQPIINIDKEILIAPAFFTHLSPLSALVAIMEKKNIYQSVNEKVEKVVNQQIGDYLKSKNFQTFLEPKIRNDKNKEFKTPDLVLVDSDLEQILVIELKNCIRPTNVFSTISKLKKTEKEHINQVLEYKNILGSENLEFENQQLNKLVKDFSDKRVFAILLFRFQMQMPILIPDWLGVVDWGSLST